MSDPKFTEGDIVLYGTDRFRITLVLGDDTGHWRYEGYYVQGRYLNHDCADEHELRPLPCEDVV